MSFLDQSPLKYLTYLNAKIIHILFISTVEINPTERMLFFSNNAEQAKGLG